MNKKEIYLSLILFSTAFVVLLLTLYPYRPIFPPLSTPTLFQITPTPTLSPVIILSPDLSLPIKSPQKIIGLIDKSWVFEASFPIELFDSQNKNIFKGIASTPSWLEDTDKYTEFSASIKFLTKSKRGYLMIKNDNPSGLPQNNKSLIIPIVYEK